MDRPPPFFLFTTLLFVFAFSLQTLGGRKPAADEFQKFQEAKKLETIDAKTACELYSKINNPKSLSRLAHVRTAITCPNLVVYQPQDSEMSWMGDWIWLAAESQKKSTKDFDKILSSLFLQSQIDVDQKIRIEALNQGFDYLKKNSAVSGSADWLRKFETQRVRIAPRFNENPSPKEFPSVIEDYFANLEYDAARKWLNLQMKTGDLKPEDLYRLKLAVAQSFKREQNKKMNLSSLKDLFVWTKKQKLPAKNQQEALTLYSRAMWTNGDRPGGEKLLKKDARLFEGELAAEIYFILARMSEEARDYRKSIYWCEQAIRNAEPNGQLEEKALFMKAWNQKKIGERKHAIESFSALTELKRKPFEIAKYMFWQAWLMEQEGQKQKSQELFEQIANQDPYGYYGLMSTIHRGKKFPPLLIQENVRGDNEDSNDEMVETLAKLKETELLKKYLDKKIALWDAKTSIETKYQQAKALSLVGSHLPLFLLFNQLDLAEKISFFKAHSDLIFPRKYSDLVFAAAKKQNLPPELIFSIIRQESTFDPEARSPADAMGLMQVLASQGATLAKRAHIKYQSYEDLKNPEVNIPLGSLLLKDVSRNFDGNLALTAGGYNANPVIVKKWIQARNRQSFIEFLEEVPYEETRTYMRLVLRNFILYRRLATPQVETSPPEECLRSLQFPKVSTGKKKKK